MQDMHMQTKPSKETLEAGEQSRGTGKGAYDQSMPQVNVYYVGSAGNVEPPGSANDIERQTLKLQELIAMQKALKDNSVEVPFIGPLVQMPS